MIEVSSLSKRYGNHLAVDNVSFSIKKGEVVGFLGPNGAGKSTIMNIMTGYLSLTAAPFLSMSSILWKTPRRQKSALATCLKSPRYTPI